MGRAAAKRGESLDERVEPAGVVDDGAEGLSDRDQTASDLDEAASAEDQEVADRELAGRGDTAAQERDREVRHRTSAERLTRAVVCDRTAADRLQIASERDEIRQRDQIAELRGAARVGGDLTPRDALHGDALPRADEHRAKAAADGAASATHRRRAATERAADPETAAFRAAAGVADRLQAVRARELAGIDQLAAAGMRTVGLAEIEVEIQRAQRNGVPLALAFVDINPPNLSTVNDDGRHLATGKLDQHLAEALRTKLRACDAVVLFGGDRFVCALANMGAEDVRSRFADLVKTLEADGYRAPISVGVADLEHGDDLERLVARADADLTEARRASGHGTNDAQAGRGASRGTASASLAKDHTDVAHHLRVLLANQREDRLARLARVVTSLGHEVIASEIHVGNVAAETARLRPDVALVGLGVSSTHALKMIGEIVRGSYCPVIALLWEYDADWITEAAERGVYAYIVDTRPEELQSAIDITLRRFVEFQEVQGAFERSNAELARGAQRALAQRRQMLELHEGVVQGLAVAKLELDLDQIEASREALVGAFEIARAIVSISLEELGVEGVPLAELLGDEAPSQK